MIDWLVESFKAYLLPGSLSFLLLSGTAFAALIFAGDRWRNIGRWGLVSLVIMYWLLSLPFVSSALVWGLAHDYQGLQTAAEAEDSQAIIVLGGGTATYEASGARLSTLSDASALRALEGERLYRLLDPKWVVVSGGPSRPTAEAESAVLKRAMVELGIPGDRILEESDSGNTYEQAVFLRRLLEPRHIQRFVLVTSGVHMARAMGVFRHAGLDPVPSPAQEMSDPGGEERARVLPSLDSLHTSQAALREILGLIYYAVRGWLAPSPSSVAARGLSLPAGAG